MAHAIMALRDDDDVAAMLAGDLGRSGEMTDEELTTLAKRITPILIARKLPSVLEQALRHRLERHPERTIHLSTSFILKCCHVAPSRMAALAEAFGVVELATGTGRILSMRSPTGGKTSAATSVALSDDVVMNHDSLELPHLSDEAIGLIRERIAVKEAETAWADREGVKLHHYDRGLQIREVEEIVDPLRIPVLSLYDVPVTGVASSATGRTTLSIEPYKTRTYRDLLNAFNLR